ncbi:MAG: hypothetical protein JSS10_08710 [Verrucomicrobia bacterium]|nr:hypothetical protein [Verrucomicrobiota bacterium]
MATSPIGSKARIRELTHAPFSSEHSLLKRANQLIQDFENKCISQEGMIFYAKELILEFDKLKDSEISIVRVGLCILLKLNIAEVQLKVITNLKPLLHLKFLYDDVEQNQSQDFLFLESTISEVIVKHLFCFYSQELLLFLIDLYQDVLDHLWLLPYLNLSR